MSKVQYPNDLLTYDLFQMSQTGNTLWFEVTVPCEDSDFYSGMWVGKV